MYKIRGLVQGNTACHKHAFKWQHKYTHVTSLFTQHFIITSVCIEKQLVQGILPNDFSFHFQQMVHLTRFQIIDWYML